MNVSPPFGTINYIPRTNVEDYTSHYGFTTWPSIRDVWLTFRWSACVWRDGLRSEANFLFADYCVLDFEESLTLREAVENVFCDFSMLVGVTQNHQRSKDGKLPGDRFRLVMPFERRITCLEEYRYNMEKIIAKYEADEQCKDAAHAYRPCRAHYFMQRTEMRYPVEKVPDWWIKKQDELMFQRCKETRILSREARILLRGNIPEGERNRMVYRGAKDLAKTGMTGEEILQEVQGKNFYLEADNEHKKGFERSVKSAIYKLTKDRNKLHERQRNANK